MAPNTPILTTTARPGAPATRYYYDERGIARFTSNRAVIHPDICEARGIEMLGNDRQGGRERQEKTFARTMTSYLKTRREVAAKRAR